MAEPAPLHATPAAPVPAGGAAEWFTGAGGVRLRAAYFPPRGAPRGAVIVSPGRSEPIEKYFETIDALSARGFAVVAHDWRGQGLSQRILADRLLGHAHGHEDFLGDFAALVAAFEARLPRPWLALGHSMGGCLILLALASGQAEFSAAILSAPMLALDTGAIPTGLARAVARLLTAIGLGGLPVRRAPPAHGFEENVLTHDRTRWERNEAQLIAWPDLALGEPTWGWLDFALTATAWLRTAPAVPRLALPVVMITAGDERIVDGDGAAVVAARLPDARLVQIPGAFHEILQETDDIRAIFWREFDALADRIAPARA